MKRSKSLLVINVTDIENIDTSQLLKFNMADGTELTFSILACRKLFDVLRKVFEPTSPPDHLQYK